MNAEHIIFIALFAIVPVSSLVLVWMKDLNRRRKVFLNVVLIANSLFYLSPLIYAYANTKAGGNMWNENGAGAAIWYYIYVLPLSVPLHLVVGKKKLESHLLSSRK
jgi:hypothetical protein